MTAKTQSLVATFGYKNIALFLPSHNFPSEKKNRVCRCGVEYTLILRPGKDMIQFYIRTLKFWFISAYMYLYLVVLINFKIFEA